MSWPCRTLTPGLMPSAKRLMVAVAGLVAVDVLDLDVAAIARDPLGLLDDAVARGIDRRALGRGEIDAGVHACGVLKIGWTRLAEAARETAAALQRPAGQEALSGLAGGIVEVDGAFVGAEAEELARRSRRA